MKGDPLAATQIKLVKQLFISGSGSFEGSQDTHSGHQHLTVCFSQVTGVSCNLCFPGHSDSALAAVGFQDSTLKSYNIWGSSAQHRLSLVGSYFLSISIHHDVFSHLLSLQEKQMCTSGPGLSAAQLS